MHLRLSEHGRGHKVKVQSLKLKVSWKCSALALATLLGASIATAQQRSTTPQRPRVPAGFRLLDDRFWEGPWVFAAGRPAALPRWHNRFLAGSGSIPMLLDDGNTGRLVVTAGPCPDRTVRGGPRDDCGCFEND